MRSRSNGSCRWATCAAALIILVTTRVHAAEITVINWYSGVASVALAAPVTAAPNNDDVSGTSPNVLNVLQKDYFGIGPVDLVFDLIDTGGTTEYVVVEGVFNGTGVDWSGYHVELGFGTGAGFTKSTAGDGLDFDAPDYDSPVDFNPAPGFFPIVATPTEDDLVASGGIMPGPSYAGNFIFHIDVPDGISSFTLRQSPIPAPEPSALLLIPLGLFAFGRTRRLRAL